MRLHDCSLAYGDNPDKRCALCGNHLPRGRKRWCSDECSRVYSRNHHWDSARAAALARDGYTCTRCGIEDWQTELHVHHLDPVGAQGYGPGCHHHLDGLETLCVPCHQNAHQVLRFLDGVTGVQLRLPLAS